MLDGHTEICICQHPANRHADIDLWSGWGLGKCELCECSKFECPQCIKDNYENGLYKNDNK